jgi:hypothetical protein
MHAVFHPLPTQRHAAEINALGGIKDVVDGQEPVLGARKWRNRYRKIAPISVCRLFKVTVSGFVMLLLCGSAA